MLVVKDIPKFRKYNEFKLLQLLNIFSILFFTDESTKLFKFKLINFLQLLNINEKSLT